MSSKSNYQGRAYEYICLHSLQDAIRAIRKSQIIHNSSYEAAEHAWNTLSVAEKALYTLSAKSTIDTIFALEPNIVEVGDDTLNLYIQSDEHGEAADVRDIIIDRKDIVWEIGLSIKHNHMAVKHSRLAKSLDFGQKWYGVNCSEEYWNDVKPIFDYLEQEKSKESKWKDLPNKEDDVYYPLLMAFKGELDRQNKLYSKDIPKLMVEYLLGEFDFYKVIGIDSKRITQVQSYNLRGTLNKEGVKRKRSIKLPIASLPTRIVSLEFKPGSKNTLELYLDRGWQFSFRIHNASSKVETSLKFDIQIIGMPTTIISIDCKWN